jgi:hypothetical protein
MPPTQALIINIDQTGVHLLTTNNCGRAQRGSKQVTRLAADDKRQITVTLGVSASGAMLPPQLIFQGASPAVLPPNRTKPEFTGWHFTYYSNHWSNADTMEDLVKEVWHPYFKVRRV